MMDLKNHVNLTEARASELNKIDFSKLPLQDAVKTVKGNGMRKIAVFSDPNCPYCHKLEEALKSIDNVTVYTFLFPILSTDSTVKSKSIWVLGRSLEGLDELDARSPAPRARPAIAIRRCSRTTSNSAARCA